MISDNNKALLICFTGILLLVLHSLYYMPFLSDDSLISLRYVQRFIQGSGLTWNDGIKVEGYSNLLWVLLSSGMGYVGIDLVDSVRILGYACGIVIVATPYLLYRKGIFTSLFGLAVPTYFLALCAPIAIWTIGGLEQPLVAALLCLFLVYFLGNDKIYWLIPGVFLALIAITRPDGIVFAGCACLCILAIHGIALRSILMCVRIMFLPLLFFIAQLIFRYEYYGMFVPNTALVKISFSMQRLVSGVKYVGIGIGSLFPFSIFVPFIIYKFFRSEQYKFALTYIGITVFLWLCYLIFIGGDIFPGSRHFLPIIPLFAITLGIGAEKIYSSEINLKKFIGYTALAFFIFLPVQFIFPNNARAKEERWEWDGKAIATMLKDEWQDKKPLFAITAAGCLPYWTEFPCIDMLGLNDYYIPRHPPKEFGKGYLGHDLGDATYVLSQSPDLISFCGPNGSLEPCFIADGQLTQEKKFNDNYLASYFQTSPPFVTNAIVWVNSKSPLLGFTTSNDTLKIPCWLFSNSKHPVTQNDGKKFKVTVQASDTLLLSKIRMSKGYWKLNGSDFEIVQGISSEAYQLKEDSKAKMLISSGIDLQNKITIVAKTAGDIKEISFVKTAD